MKNIFILTLCFGIFFTTLHSANADTIDFTNLNQQELEKAFNTEATKLMSTNAQTRMEAALNLKKFQYNETAPIICAALQYHMHTYLIDIDDEFMEVLFETLESTATVLHNHYLGILSQHITHYYEHLDDRIEKELQDRLMVIYGSVTDSRKHLPNLKAKSDKKYTQDEKLLPKPVDMRDNDVNKVTLIDYMHIAEDYLKENLIGQPEITHALINSLLRDQIISGRDTPEIFYLLGGPGTGKDTASMLITNAIHGGDDKAHERHMFTVERMAKEAEIWRLIGSPTGYKGSDGIPPLLRFAIEHSGGRYFIDEKPALGGKSEEVIMENLDWKPEDAKGYKETDAVVFLNEYHNWSKAAKDALKAFLERGHLTINNPQGNVEVLDFKPRIMIASNEGIEELTSRDRFGRRQGKALTYKQLIEKWEIFAKDIERIKKSILKTNVKGGAADDDAPGISEETLNRIPIYNFLVLRPHSPEGLQRIAALNLKSLAKKLNKESDSIGAIELEWSENLPVFLQEYDYNAEENARPIKDKINSLIVSTIIEGVREEKIKLSLDNTKVSLDVQQEDNKSWSLIVKVTKPGSKKETTVTLPIHITEKDIPVQPVSEEQLEEWGQVKEKLMKKVLGIEHITERLSREIVNAMEEAYINLKSKEKKKRASVFAFFGLSSNGKTETAKVLTEAMYGSRDNLTTISFNNINSRHEMKEFLLGIKHPDGTIEESAIHSAMKRHNNKVVINLDEIVNVKDPEALKMLYDFFDEPVVTFADGTEESMGGVTFVLTGNVGDKIYKQIPKNGVSKKAQRHLYAQAYEIFMSNPEARNNLLYSMLPDPLVKRIGLKRIFFFGPLNYQHSRGITQIALFQAIEKLGRGEGSRAWDIKFDSVEDFRELVDAIDDVGFSVEEQGRSIREMVDDQFYVAFKTLMHDHKIPSGTKVWVSVDKTAEPTMAVGSSQYELLRLNLHVEGQKNPIKLNLQGTEVMYTLDETEEDRIKTAFHEAGHELVRKVFFDKYTDHGMITTRPGIAQINGDLIYYAGVARSVNILNASSTRENIIRQMARLAGGYVAEKLVTKGHRHGQGKHNDMERATELAYRAIIVGGLSPEWGTETVLHGVPVREYVNMLPEDRRALLNKLVKEMLQEAEFLALKALRANFETGLIPLGTQLAKTGTLNRQDLTDFYAANTVNTEGSNGYENVNFKDTDRELFEDAPVQSAEKTESLFDKLNQKTSSQKNIDIEFVDEVPKGLKPLEVEVMEQAYKDEIVKEFKLREADIPVEKRSKSCADLLTD